MKTLMRLMFSLFELGCIVRKYGTAISNERGNKNDLFPKQQSLIRMSVHLIVQDHVKLFVLLMQ